MAGGGGGPGHLVCGNIGGLEACGGWRGGVGRGGVGRQWDSRKWGSGQGWFSVEASGGHRRGGQPVGAATWWELGRRVVGGSGAAIAGTLLGGDGVGKVSKRRGVGPVWGEGGLRVGCGVPHRKAGRVRRQGDTGGRGGHYGVTGGGDAEGEGGDYGGGARMGWCEGGFWRVEVRGEGLFGCGGMSLPEMSQGGSGREVCGCSVVLVSVANAVDLGYVRCRWLECLRLEMLNDLLVSGFVVWNLRGLFGPGAQWREGRYSVVRRVVWVFKCIFGAWGWVGALWLTGVSGARVKGGWGLGRWCVECAVVAGGLVCGLWGVRSEGRWLGGCGGGVWDAWGGQVGRELRVGVGVGRLSCGDGGRSRRTGEWGARVGVEQSE
ncbi:hypothetical protein Tco_1292698 [Tanacetum coccineum]